MIDKIQTLLDKLPASRRNRIESAFWSAYGGEGEPDPIAAKQIASYIKEIVHSQERKASEKAARDAFEDKFRDL